MRTSWCVVTLATGMAVAVQAQTVGCDSSNRHVAVRLVTREGIAVADAAIEVRRVLRRTLVHGATSLGAGTYRVLDDRAVPDLKAGGEPFDITFRRHDRMTRVRLIIGMDAAHCHVAVKGGRTTVRL